MAKAQVLTWKELEDNDAIKQECLGYTRGLVRSSPGDWVLQPATAALAEEYRGMEVRGEDVWIVTYPKCGTTWTQELIWQVAHGVDLKGGQAHLNERFPFLELDTLMAGYMSTSIFRRLFNWFFGWLATLHLLRPSTWFGYRHTAAALTDLPRHQRRFIKSHLPLSMLPPDLLTKAKVVYVVRNPKDVIVSYYHHHKLINGHGYTGDLPNFARRFMRNEIMQGPFFPHAKEAWALKDHPNMLFLFYEDLKEDLRGAIGRVSSFLERPLTPDQLDTLVDHLHITNFRRNTAVNPTSLMKTFGLMSGDGNFVRQGKVGGWKEEFAGFPEVERELEEWVAAQAAASPVPFRAI